MKRDKLFNELIMLAAKKSVQIERNGSQHEVELEPIRRSQRGSKTKPIPSNNQLRAELMAER